MRKPRPTRHLSGAVRSAAAVAGAALLISACGGGDAGATAVALIETEIEREVGLGPLEATCEVPAEQAEGTEFTCTALTEAGQTIEFDGVFTADDAINVQTTNVLLPDDIAFLVERSVESINVELGASATPEDVTCDEGTVVLEAGAFECVIVDTTDGVSYPLTIDTGGLQDGEPVDPGWELGDPIE